MAAMIAEVYSAFLEAGASPEKATQAAEAIAAYENRFTKVERESADGFAEVKRELVAVRGELNLLKWMMGFLLVGVGSLVIRTFFG